MLRAGPSEGERGAQVLHPVPERVRSGTGCSTHLPTAIRDTLRLLTTRTRAACRQVLLDFPLDLADRRIPRDEPATVTARAREHAHDRADVRLAGRVLHLYALVVHADVVRGDVEELGLR